MSNFIYKEFDKFVQNIDTADKDLETYLKKFLLEQAQRVVRDAKLITPVDTGTLRNSFVIGNESRVLRYGADGKVSGTDYASGFAQNASYKDVERQGSNYSVTISNPVKYASWIEFGHHSYPAQLMLTKSANNVQNKIPARLKAGLKEYYEEKLDNK